MIIKFRYGFYYNEILFGWSKQKLYRLPQMIGTRFYPLKAVKQNKSGLYYISDRLKSKKQLEFMTVVIDKEVQLIRDADVPF
jgi:hypothetical protein